MFKVIFFQTYYNPSNVQRQIESYRMKNGKIPLNGYIASHPEEIRTYTNERMRIKKLFECYCVNQFQIEKIKKYLESNLPINPYPFKYFIGYNKYPVLD